MPLENFGRIYAQAYAGATGVKLVPVPGAAHFVMLDQPDTTMAAISGFLKGQ
jgi:pimeloyl-ACP methyl ester carboxylesterase